MARPRPRAGNVSRAAGPLGGPEAEDNVAAKGGSWTAAEEVARVPPWVEAIRARQGLGAPRARGEPRMLRGRVLGTRGPRDSVGAAGAAPGQGAPPFHRHSSWQVFYSQTWRKNKASPSPHPRSSPKRRGGTRMNDERQEAGRLLGLLILRGIVGRGRRLVL